jgi:hypothetical protein
MKGEFEDFFEVASSGEPVHLREFAICSQDKTYVIKVTYPGYMNELKMRNSQRPPEARVDEKIFVLEDISNAEEFSKIEDKEILGKFRDIPLNRLNDFLQEQEPEE